MSGYLYFFCTHCRARNRWPRNCVGQTLTCPSCQKQFVDDDPYWPAEDSLPDARPSSAAVGAGPKAAIFSMVGQLIAGLLSTRSQTPARGVERESAAATADQMPGTVRLAEPLQPLYAAPGLRDLNPGQRTLYCLLIKTFHSCFAQRLDRIISYGLSPFFFLVGVLVLFLFMGLAHVLFLAAGLCLCGGANFLLFAIVLLVILMAVVLVPSMEEVPISLSYDWRGGASEIHLGRAGDALSAANVCVLGAIFGACLGAQAGLLYFAQAEIGMARPIGVWESLLITLDNFVHGLSLGAFESLDFHVADKFEHSAWSATWFFLCRLSFVAVLFVWLVRCVRGSSLRAHGRSYPPRLHPDSMPAARADVHMLCDWMAMSCQDSQSPWPHYADALLFLALAAAYLRGQFDTVRELGQRLAGANIHDSVKVLFVDGDNARLLLIEDGNENAPDE